MSYKVLSKVFYKDIEEYKNLCEQRKNSEAVTFFNIKIHSNEAFYCLCPEIYSLTTEIMQLDKKVCKIRKELPPVAVNQFTNKCLIDEIVLTNDIEGVYSTRKEISIILNDVKEKSINKRFYGLVTKYKMLSRNEISLKNCSDVREVYDELVLPEIIADDPDNAPDGKIFRKELAEVSTATQKIIHKGLLPEEKIVDAMEQALKILNDEQIPHLIRISVFHYLFGYIHPFYDGNGRTSRFISSYLLSKNFEYLIGYRLSYTIKENISEYYEAFKICNDEKNCGDVTPFILMFLDIIRKSYEKLYEALVKRSMRLEEYDKKIAKKECLDKSLYGVYYVLLQAALFSNDGITKNELCETLQISESTLAKRLKKIDDYLIIKKIERVNHYSLNLKKIDE